MSDLWSKNKIMESNSRVCELTEISEWEYRRICRCPKGEPSVEMDY